MSRGVLLALAALMLAPATASAGITGFQMPSGKIFCAYIDFEEERSFRCDITGMRNEPAPKPASCEFDYGSSFGLSPRGKARRLCVSDTPMDPSFKKLAYGTTWKRGPYTCRSRRTNLRCTNRGGHGFELNRSRQRLF